MTRCTVTGVYATLHTTAGDFDTGVPSAIRVDCETMYFDLPIESSPFDGSVTAVTLHFGVLPIRLRASSPHIRLGDRVTIVQEMRMIDLLPESDE